MKTAKKIIKLLEAEQAEAYEMYDAAKGCNTGEAHYYLIKATVIQHLLDEIKN